MCSEGLVPSMFPCVGLKLHAYRTRIAVHTGPACPCGELPYRIQIAVEAPLRRGLADLWLGHDDLAATRTAELCWAVYHIVTHICMATFHPCGVRVLLDSHI